MEQWLFNSNVDSSFVVSPAQSIRKLGELIGYFLTWSGLHGSPLYVYVHIYNEKFSKKGVYSRE